MRTFSNFSRRLPVLALMTLFLAACDDSPTGPIGNGLEFGDSGGSGAAPVASVLMSRTLTQVDRTGFPAITTAMIASGADKDAFNLAAPAGDETDFFVTLTETLMARYGLTQAGADGLADFVLPDIVPLGNLSGFPNGRRLEDDVLDIELGLIFGVFGPSVPALETDNVDGNDVPFLNTFPYLAGPQTS